MQPDGTVATESAKDDRIGGGGDQWSSREIKQNEKFVSEMVNYFVKKTDLMLHEGAVAEWSMAKLERENK